MMRAKSVIQANLHQNVVFKQEISYNETSVGYDFLFENTDDSNWMYTNYELPIIYIKPKFQIKNNYCPRRYVYLYKDPDKKHHDVDCLAVNERLTNRSFIIRDETAHIHNYIHFESAHEYIKLYGEYSHNCHEVILHWQVQKPKFDIDGSTEDIHREIIDAIFFAFLCAYNIEVKMQQILSVNTRINETKLSRHVIVTNYAFKNQQEAKWFTEECLRPRLSQEASTCLDKVNKKTQNFRLPYAINNKGRYLIPRLKCSITDLFVTYIAEDMKVLPEKYHEYINKYQAPIYGPALNMADIDIGMIMRVCATHLVGWYKPKLNNGFINFERTTDADHYCDFCLRDHDKDNTRYLRVSKKGIYLGCNKQKGASLRLIHQFTQKIPDQVINVPESALKDNQLNLKDMFAEGAQIIYNEPKIRSFEQLMKDNTPIKTTLYIYAPQ